MSDGLVSRLRDYRIWNHAHHRYDAVPVVQEAATALTEARAEIERLRGEIERRNFIQAMNGPTAQDKAAIWQKQAEEMAARADAAESELSTLRARVREVVGPFAALEATGWTGSYLSEPGHDGSDVSVLHHAASNTTVTRGHFRAARQLMEEVK